MALVSANDLFFTQFEPKQPNRFILTIDGFPAFIMKGVSAVSLTQGEVVLNHINIYQKVKGKTTWGDLSFTMYDPITPSGAHAVMDWVRLHHESVTGRDGYSDFYKKQLYINIIGPPGDIVSEWVIVGAFIKEANFGEYSWDTADQAVNISMTVGMDYCVLNY
jgi:hypothetical protein